MAEGGQDEESGELMLAGAAAGAAGPQGAATTDTTVPTLLKRELDTATANPVPSHAHTPQPIALNIKSESLNKH